MALIGVNPSAPRQKGPSTLEQIAAGVDIATKVLGLGLQGYKTFGIDKPQAEARAQYYKAQAENEKYQTPKLSEIDNATIKAYGEQNYIPTSEGDSDNGKILVVLPDSGKKVFYKPGKPAKEKLDALTGKFKDDFVQDQAVKDFRTIHGAANAVIKSFEGKSLDVGDSGRDLGLLFAYMKVLDPGSRVTGSEVELTQGASPVAVQIAQQYSKLFKERGILDAGLRKSMLANLRDTYLARQSDYQAIEDQMRMISQASSVDPFNVIPKINKIDFSRLNEQLKEINNGKPWEKYK